MKRRPAAGRLKGLAELKSVRIARPSFTLRATEGSFASGPGAHAPGPEANEFLEAMRGVTPLALRSPKGAGGPSRKLAQPHPVQRERDDQAVLDESLSDQIGIETLLDTDEALSYRRNGISVDTLRKLRRGFWVVQAELDLHGHRVAEAQLALGAFLREAMQNGQRCVRIVHGKGRGSRDGVPVLKGKVRSWLARSKDVIAFCQARPPDGGAGALLVLLRPC